MSAIYTCVPYSTRSVSSIRMFSSRYVFSVNPTGTGSGVSVGSGVTVAPGVGSGEGVGVGVATVSKTAVFISAAGSTARLRTKVSSARYTVKAVSAKPYSTVQRWRFIQLSP